MVCAGTFKPHKFHPTSSGHCGTAELQGRCRGGFNEPRKPISLQSRVSEGLHTTPHTQVSLASEVAWQSLSRDGMSKNHLFALTSPTFCCRGDRCRGDHSDGHRGAVVRFACVSDRDLG